MHIQIQKKKKKKLLWREYITHTCNKVADALTNYKLANEIIVWTGNPPNFSDPMPEY